MGCMPPPRNYRGLKALFLRVLRGHLEHDGYFWDPPWDILGG